MNILHVIPALKTGGAERLAIDICNEINRHPEHRAVLLVLSSDANAYSFISQRLTIRHTSSFVSLSIWRKNRIDLTDFQKFVKEFKPQIIHSHLFSAEIFSREDLFQECRYFTHCHDNMPQFRNFSWRTLFSKKMLTDFFEKQHLLKQYTSCKNSFLAISEHTKEYFDEVLPSELAQRVTLFENAINFKLFNSACRDRTTDKLRIINVGSFVAKKNQLLLIAIGSELLKRNLPFEIVLLGDGPMHTGVKQAVAEKGLQKHVIMPGNVQNMENYYASANLYVHTATYEPFGLVLLEAMASGLPVISLDGGGNRHLVLNNENGFLIKHSNEQLFADKIEQLFNNQQLYHQLAEGAVTFSKRYDIEGYADKLLQLYAMQQNKFGGGVKAT